jgi:metallophosphoesterase (TIGR03767 family)
MPIASAPRRSAIVAAALAVAAAAAAAAAPAALADTTVERTIRAADGGTFKALANGRGEPYAVRRGGPARADSRRGARRRSLLLFAQVTDPQVVDEMSPARVDFVDPAGGDLRAAWRPQEALGLQVLDQVVRGINANRRSPVAQAGGRRAKLAIAITTGDLADNQHYNETVWFRSVLDGGPVDPFSGRAIDAANPCSGASAEETAAINAGVGARSYTGVQDYDDYRSAPAARYAGFWDPDEAPPVAGPHAAFPRYPGLMDRAQAPFEAAGLDVPWFISRGNHDGLVQGVAPASEELFRAIATGCLKVMPSAGLDPQRFAGASESEFFDSLSSPEFLGQLLAGASRVAPDPDRRIVGKAEYRRLMGGGRAHGFGYTERKELRASGGTASYYAWTPRRGLRFISLDTVAEGGGQSGNLDDPQYRWLERELRTAARRNQLVVAFGHHTIGTMTNARTDEQAGACATPDEPGCDRDGRRSTPLHLGLRGKRTVRALLASTPSVIAYVAGHTHDNAVRFFGGRGGSGFWEVNTASHIDFPQQSRLIEIMDNRDGTLSLFGTVLDHAAPAQAPAPGPAGAFSVPQLASLARVLSFNDPQREAHTGSRRDRNVELLVRDPR